MKKLLATALDYANETPDNVQRIMVRIANGLNANIHEEMIYRSLRCFLEYDRTISLYLAQFKPICIRDSISAVQSFSIAM